MKTGYKLSQLAVVTTLVTAVSSPSFGQADALASPLYKHLTPIAPGVAAPSELETSIGTPKLTDGHPKPETVEKICDNLAFAP